MGFRIAALLLAIVAAGCAATSIEADQVARIEEGKTTFTELKSWFGEPSDRGDVGDGTT